MARFQETQPHALLDLIESTTTPQSEDWQIILAGQTAHIMALQEDPTPMGRAMVSMGLFEVPISEVKRRIKNLDREPGPRPLGCVTVVLCRDAMEPGKYFLSWLTNQARKKRFSVISIAGSTTTAEALEIQRQSLDWVPPGFSRLDSVAVAGHA